LIVGIVTSSVAITLVKRERLTGCLRISAFDADRTFVPDLDLVVTRCTQLLEEDAVRERCNMGSGARENLTIVSRTSGIWAALARTPPPTGVPPLGTSLWKGSEAR
jgi:hypothetical protein